MLCVSMEQGYLTIYPSMDTEFYNKGFILKEGIRTFEWGGDELFLVI